MSENQIPECFDEMDVVENPRPRQRKECRETLGDSAVPDEGPIPDYKATHCAHPTVAVPTWILAVLAKRLDLDPETDPPTTSDIESALYDVLFLEPPLCDLDGMELTELFGAEECRQGRESAYGDLEDEDCPCSISGQLRGPASREEVSRLY